MSQNIWLKLFDKKRSPDKQLEFTVDTYLVVDTIPRIGETIWWLDVAYECTHVIHDFNTKGRIAIAGKEIEGQNVDSATTAMRERD